MVQVMRNFLNFFPQFQNYVKRNRPESELSDKQNPDTGKISTIVVRY
jgi:hypothetical protein